MAQFFIHRPVFAWVIALFILVLGGVALTQLPVAQYPKVAPPSIVISAAYPGASAQTLEDSVISVIEREMNGSPGLIYMESVSQADGSGQLTLSFEPGTNAELAQVDVQNRLGRATPRPVSYTHLDVYKRQALECVQRAVDGQAFDGAHRAPGHRRQRRHAGAHGLAVDVHGAGAAGRHAAAELGAAQVEHVTQHPQQRHRRVDPCLVERAHLAVDLEFQPQLPCSPTTTAAAWR